MIHWFRRQIGRAIFEFPAARSGDGRSIMMADAALTASGEPHGPETGKSLRCAPVSSPLALALAFAMAHGLATPLGSFPFACQSTAAHVRACFKRGQRRPGRIAATGGRQCERACMQPTGPCTGDRCTQLLFFTETCVALRGVAGLSVVGRVC